MLDSVSLCAPPDVTSYSKVGVRCIISIASMSQSANTIAV